MAVKGSPNYVWFTAQLLGRGAMGNVYIARHRKKGSLFAAKVFNPETRMMQKDYMKAELKIFESLPRHENIIKFITVEEETYSKDKVFIMELCESGSLQNILDKPQNYYGLEEEEFLLVFRHISFALEHLIENHIVHRDVKPGNILLQITPDARHVYKLIDFGAACRLDEDDEGFKSLCGTEEYLHPRMHQAAFIRRISGQRYNNSVDLWSLGVTMYQCATGKLPFLPKAGIRNDKQMMHKLMTEKADDVISQVEHPEGVIKSSTELSETSPLTSGTRAVITTLLRQLLSVGHPVVPAAFLDTVHRFFAKVKLYLFDLYEAKHITVYMDKGNKIGELLEAIELQIKRKPSCDQLLMSDGSLLENEQVENYPITSTQNPIFILPPKPAVEFNPSLNWSPRIAEVAQYPTGLDQNADSKWAKEVYGMVWYLSRFTAALKLHQQLMIIAKKALRSSIMTGFERMSMVLFRVGDLMSILRGTADDVQVYLHGAAHGHSSQGCTCLTNLRSEYDQAQQKVTEVTLEHETLQERKDAIGRILRGMGRKEEGSSCVSPDRCQEKIDKMVKDGEPLFQQILQDKGKELQHNDVEIHKFARSELKRLCRVAREQVDRHCVQQLELNHKRTMNDIRKLREVKLQLHKLDEDVETFDKQQKSVLQQMTKIFTIRLPSPCHKLEDQDAKTQNLSFHSEDYLQRKGATGAQAGLPDSGIGKGQVCTDSFKSSEAEKLTAATGTTQIHSCSYNLHTYEFDATKLSEKDIDYGDNSLLQSLAITSAHDSMGFDNPGYLSSQGHTSRTSRHNMEPESTIGIVQNCSRDPVLTDGCSELDPIGAPSTRPVTETAATESPNTNRGGRSQGRYSSRNLRRFLSEFDDVVSVLAENTALLQSVLDMTDEPD